MILLYRWISGIRDHINEYSKPIGIDTQALTNAQRKLYTDTVSHTYWRIDVYIDMISVHSQYGWQCHDCVCKPWFIYFMSIQLHRQHLFLFRHFCCRYNCWQKKMFFNSVVNRLDIGWSGIAWYFAVAKQSW